MKRASWVLGIVALFSARAALAQEAPADAPPPPPAATLRTRLAPQLAEVSAIVSTASGARAGDALEAALLRAAFAELPPVLVPKAVHGEYGGGTLATALLALAGADFARPAACREPDPDLGVAPACGRVYAARVLCTALAAGGAVAWSLLETP